MIRTETAYPAERAQHDAVILASANQATAITDAYGLRSDPYLVVDLLARLENRGLISRAGRLAAESFRDDFAAACFDQLHAANLEAPVVSGRSGPNPDTGRRAKDRIRDALAKLDGAWTERGSCAWHVIGLGAHNSGHGDPLAVWARLRRWNDTPLSRPAEAILVDTIAALAEMGYDERRSATV